MAIPRNLPRFSGLLIRYEVSSCCKHRVQRQGNGTLLLLLLDRGAICWRHAMTLLCLGGSLTRKNAGFRHVPVLRKSWSRSGAWKTHGRRRRPEGFGGWNFNVYFILCLFSLGLGGTFFGRASGTTTILRVVSW